MPLRGRFAPSPSGRMHLGNLMAALLAWLGVRSAGGAMVLRIEDLDPARCTPQRARTLVEDLRWLGLDWDEGGLSPAYLQSCRGEYYARAFEKLKQMGLTYPCACTRAQRLAASAPHRGEGESQPCPCAALTPARQRELEEGGRRPAYRVRVPEERVEFTDGCLGPYAQDLRRDCGDFILRRSDGVWAYQLAVVVDDALMGVTQVVRGSDLLSSTPRQIWLHKTLGFPPPAYYHIPLLTDETGRRLSKRDGDLDMAALRRRYTNRELVGLLGWLAGQLPRPEPISPEELTARFSWERVPKHDIVLPRHMRA